MAREDFFVRFGSNAKPWAEGLEGQLAPAVTAVTHLEGVIKGLDEYSRAAETRITARLARIAEQAEKAANGLHSLPTDGGGGGGGGGVNASALINDLRDYNAALDGIFSKLSVFGSALDTMKDKMERASGPLTKAQRTAGASEGQLTSRASGRRGPEYMYPTGTVQGQIDASSGEIIRAVAKRDRKIAGQIIKAGEALPDGTNIGGQSAKKGAVGAVLREARGLDERAVKAQERAASALQEGAALSKKERRASLKDVPQATISAAAFDRVVKAVDKGSSKVEKAINALSERIAAGLKITETTAGGANGKKAGRTALDQEAIRKAIRAGLADVGGGKKDKGGFTGTKQDLQRLIQERVAAEIGGGGGKRKKVQTPVDVDPETAEILREGETQRRRAIKDIKKALKVVGDVPDQIAEQIVADAQATVLGAKAKRKLSKQNRGVLDAAAAAAGPEGRQVAFQDIIRDAGGVTSRRMTQLGKQILTTTGAMRSNEDAMKGLRESIKSGELKGKELTAAENELARREREAVVLAGRRNDALRAYVGSESRAEQAERRARAAATTAAQVRATAPKVSESEAARLTQLRQDLALAQNPERMEKMLYTTRTREVAGQMITERVDRRGSGPESLSKPDLERIALALVGEGYNQAAFKPGATKDQIYEGIKAAGAEMRAAGGATITDFAHGGVQKELVVAESAAKVLNSAGKLEKLFAERPEMPATSMSMKTGGRAPWEQRKGQLELGGGVGPSELGFEHTPDAIQVESKALAEFREKVGKRARRTLADLLKQDASFNPYEVEQGAVTGPRELTKPKTSAIRTIQDTFTWFDRFATDMGAAAARLREADKKLAEVERDLVMAVDPADAKALQASRRTALREQAQAQGQYDDVHAAVTADLHGIATPEKLLDPGIQAGVQSRVAAREAAEQRREEAAAAAEESRHRSATLRSATAQTLFGAKVFTDQYGNSRDFVSRFLPGFTTNQAGSRIRYGAEYATEGRETAEGRKAERQINTASRGYSSQLLKLQQMLEEGGHSEADLNKVRERMRAKLNLLLEAYARSFVGKGRPLPSELQFLPQSMGFEQVESDRYGRLKARNLKAVGEQAEIAALSKAPSRAEVIAPQAARLDEKRNRLAEVEARLAEAEIERTSTTVALAEAEKAARAALTKGKKAALTKAEADQAAANAELQDLRKKRGKGDDVAAAYNKRGFMNPQSKSLTIDRLPEEIRQDREQALANKKAEIGSMPEAQRRALAEKVGQPLNPDLPLPHDPTVEAEAWFREYSRIQENIASAPNTKRGNTARIAAQKVLDQMRATLVSDQRDDQGRMTDRRFRTAQGRDVYSFRQIHGADDGSPDVEHISKVGRSSAEERTARLDAQIEPLVEEQRKRQQSINKLLGMEESAERGAADAARSKVSSLADEQKTLKKIVEEREALLAAEVKNRARTRLAIAGTEYDRAEAALKANPGDADAKKDFFVAKKRRNDAYDAYSEIFGQRASEGGTGDAEKRLAAAERRLAAAREREALEAEITKDEGNLKLLAGAQVTKGHRVDPDAETPYAVARRELDAKQARLAELDKKYPRAAVSDGALEQEVEAARTALQVMRDSDRKPLEPREARPALTDREITDREIARYAGDAGRERIDPAALKRERAQLQRQGPYTARDIDELTEVAKQANKKAAKKKTEAAQEEARQAQADLDAAKARKSRLAEIRAALRQAEFETAQGEQKAVLEAKRAADEERKAATRKKAPLTERASELVAQRAALREEGPHTAGDVRAIASELAIAKKERATARSAVTRLTNKGDASPEGQEALRLAQENAAATEEAYKAVEGALASTKARKEQIAKLTAEIREEQAAANGGKGGGGGKGGSGSGGKGGSGAGAGKGGSYMGILEKILNAIKEVNSTLKGGGLKVTTTTEGKTATAVTAGAAAAGVKTPQQRPRMVTSTPEGREAIANAEGVKAAVPNLMEASSAEEELNKALTLVSKGLMNQSQAVAFFGDKLDHTRAQSKEFADELRIMARAADQEAKIQKAAAAADKERERQQQKAVTQTKQAATAQKQQTQATIQSSAAQIQQQHAMTAVSAATQHQVQQLRAMVAGNAPVMTQTQQMIKIYQGLQQQMPNAAPGTVKNTAQSLFASAGVNMTGGAMSSISQAASQTAQHVDSTLGSQLGRLLFGSSGFTGRVLHTVGTFIVRNFGAGLVFGLTNALQKVIQQAIEAEQTFIRVSDALHSTGRDIGSLRTDLQDVSSKYGQDLNDTYKTAAGLVGLFHTTKEISGATEIVAQLQLISGGALSADEALGVLASTTSSYSEQLTSQFNGSHLDGLKHVADVFTVIQNELGTNIEVTSEGLSRFSGLANQMGLSFEEASVYVAQVAKLTDQTGAGAGEQLSRILQSLSTGRSRNIVAKDFGTINGKPTGIQQALDTSNYSDILKIMSLNWDKLTRAQQQNISVTVAGQRQAASFAGLMKGGARALDVIKKATDESGAAMSRADKLVQTLQNELSRLDSNFQILAENLLQAGLLDVFVILLKGANGLVGGIGHLVGEFNQLTDSGVLLWLKHITVGLLGLAAAAFVVRRALAGFGQAFKTMQASEGPVGAFVRGTATPPPAPLIARPAFSTFGPQSGVASGSLLTRGAAYGFNRLVQRPLGYAGLGLGMLGVGDGASGPGLPTGRVSSGLRSLSLNAMTEVPGAGGSYSLEHTGMSRTLSGIATASEGASRSLSKVSSALGSVAFSGLALDAAMIVTGIAISKWIEESQRESRLYDAATKSRQDLFGQDRGKTTDEQNPRYYGPATDALRQESDKGTGFWDTSKALVLHGLGGIGIANDVFHGNTPGPTSIMKNLAGMQGRDVNWTLNPTKVNYGDLFSGHFASAFQTTNELSGATAVNNLRKAAHVAIKASSEKLGATVDTVTKVEDEVTGPGSALDKYQKKMLREYRAGTISKVQYTVIASQIEKAVTSLGDDSANFIAAMHGVHQMQLDEIQHVNQLFSAVQSLNGGATGYGVNLAPYLRELAKESGINAVDPGTKKILERLKAGGLNTVQMATLNQKWLQKSVKQLTTLYLTKLNTAPDEAAQILPELQTAVQNLGASSQALLDAITQHADDIAAAALNQGDTDKAVAAYQRADERILDDRQKRVARLQRLTRTFDKRMEAYARQLRAYNVTKGMDDAINAMRTILGLGSIGTPLDPGAAPQKPKSPKTLKRDEHQKQVAEDKATRDNVQKEMQARIDAINRYYDRLIAGAAGAAAKAAIEKRRSDAIAGAYNDLPKFEQKYVDKNAQYEAQTKALQTAKDYAQAMQDQKIAQMTTQAASLWNESAAQAAQQNIALVQYQWALAHYDANSAEVAAALQNLIQQQHASVQLADSQAEAAGQTAIAHIAQGNTVGVARKTLEEARKAVGRARKYGLNSTEYQGALQQMYSAQQGVTTATSSVAVAQAQMAQAYAEAAGNTVEAARIGIRVALKQLAAARKAAGGANSPDVINARAGVVQARAAARDAALQDRLDTIDFNLQMGRITQSSAIAALRQILKTRDLTKAQRRSLLLEIKGMQDQMADDQWNFGDIKLPAPYQMRRYIEERKEALKKAVDAGADSTKANGLMSGSQISAGVGSTTTVNHVTHHTTNIRIDGADVGKVKKIIQEVVGGRPNTRTIQGRRGR